MGAFAVSFKVELRKIFYLEMLCFFRIQAGLFFKHCPQSIVEQGWRSGESARLPPMWPEFNSGPVSYVG